jgi:hypothetical protein
MNDTTINENATHVLTIDGKEHYVTAIAYRPEASVDSRAEGNAVAPRLATRAEIWTGIAADGHEILISLARPTVAASLLRSIQRYGWSGEYLGSTIYRNGPLGNEWSWQAGMLLSSDGEPPRQNCSWQLREVERAEDGRAVIAGEGSPLL